MKRNSFFKRFIPVLLVCAFLCNSTTAFALTEPANAEASNTRMELITEDDTLRRAEALDMLGLTEEQATNGQIYLLTQEVPVSTLSTNSDVIGVNEYREYAPFTFHYSNTGHSFGVAGTKLNYAFKWRWLNAYSRNSLSIHVRLLDTRGTCDYTTTSNSGWGNGDEIYAYSDTVSVSPSYAYHFVYTTNYSYTVEETPTPNVEITMAVWVTA